MQVKTEKQTRFADELGFIPRWAWVVAGLGLICMPIVSVTVLAHDPKAPSFWLRVAIGIVGGLFLGCYVLLIGYVNRDAGRRGGALPLAAIPPPRGIRAPAAPAPPTGRGACRSCDR